MKETAQIENKDIVSTNKNIYLFYGAAKMAGLKPGDEFVIAGDPAKERFTVGRYADWIPERHCKFSGYRVEQCR